MTARQTLGLLLTGAGIGLLWDNVGWQTALGVALIVVANNLITKQGRGVG